MARRSSETDMMAKSMAPSSSSTQLRIPPPPSCGAFSRKSVDWNSDKDNIRSNLITGTRRPQTEVTIVIMGSTRVGKSAIVNQFLHGVFQEEYKETVDDMHWIEYDATSSTTSPPGSSDSSEKQKDQRQNPGNVGIFLLKIIDSSGSREFIGMRKLYEQQGDAFVLVISVEDRESFEEAKVLRREIGERNRKNAPAILVLTKIDLRETMGTSAVKAEEVQQFANETGSLFIEATATKYESVADIFQKLLEHHSSIPSASQLKYRRKSVPVSLMVADFESVAKGPRRGTLGENYSEIPEEEGEQVDDKKQPCRIS